MSLYSYFRISKPSQVKVPQEQVPQEYRRLRNRTFWGATAAYSIYYVCRMTLSVVKQPLIDDGILSAGDLGLIGSALLFVYAIGKFINGFVADYCNVRKFMATGLIASALINLLLGAFGFIGTAVSVPGFVVMLLFALLWGLNGWAQSMGAAPGVISLSRWFPLSSRGTFYSIFSATPYLGEFLTFILLGFLVKHFGWQSCFMIASLIGLAGGAAILIFVNDTPESKGLPSVQEISGEQPTENDRKHTSELQKLVLRKPGIWVIAISSAFIYITKYAITGWGVLFLQKAKEMSIENASQVIAFSSAFGILGTVTAGWLSDRLFRGDRAKPAAIAGILATAALGAFLFLGDSFIMNILYVSVFSLAVGVLYCIVAGLMALDFVPRKATGAALGIVGISSYVAAGIQDVVSGYMIEGNIGPDGSYDFLPVAIFWMIAAGLSFILPVLNWKYLKR